MPSTVDLSLALFKRADPEAIARRYASPLGRTVWELQGRPCIELEELEGDRKSVACSKSFGRPVGDLDELRAALATHVSHAAEKLRQRGLLATSLHVSIATNPFRDDAPRHAEGLMLPLAEPTSATPPLLAAALAGLARLHRPGLFYHKTGVVLTGLLATATLARQPTLFPDPPPDPTPNRPAIDPARANRLTAALDQINQRFGRDTLRYAVTGLQRPWAMRQRFLSPVSTTDWQRLPQGTCRPAVSRRARSAIEAGPHRVIDHAGSTVIRTARVTKWRLLGSFFVHGLHGLTRIRTKSKGDGKNVGLKFFDLAERVVGGRAGDAVDEMVVGAFGRGGEGLDPSIAHGEPP